MARTETQEFFDKLLYDVRNLLQEDVDRYWDALEKEDNQFWRRGLVRATFAYIEGLTYSIKLEALFMHKALQAASSQKKLDLPEEASFQDFIDALGKQIEQSFVGAGFSPFELLFLTDLSVDLSENGEIKARWAKITLEKNIVFAFRAYAKAFGVEFKIDKSGQGWQDFKRAVKVRDRLMHPKRLQDLIVADGELKEIMRSYTWIMQQLVDVNNLIKASKKDHKSDENEAST